MQGQKKKNGLDFRSICRGNFEGDILILGDAHIYFLVFNKNDFIGKILYKNFENYNIKK